MNVAEYFYYNIVYGAIPDNVTYEDIEKTNKTIQYILDSGIEKEMLLDIINMFPRKNYILPKDIPSQVWNLKNDNLLHKDEFYYHKELRISSKSPTLNINTGEITTEKFFLEMKIAFTLEDLYNYFNKCFPRHISNKEQDIGALKYLLGKYEKTLEDIKAVDFLLCLIDFVFNKTKNNTALVTTPLNLANFENDVYKNLKNIIDESKYSNLNKIIWR